METISFVFEYNGSDVAIVAFEADLPAMQLLATAQQIARTKETDISEITMRFALKGGTHEDSTTTQATD